MTRKARDAAKVRFEQEAECGTNPVTRRRRRRAAAIVIVVLALAAAGGWFGSARRAAARAKAERAAAAVVAERRLDEARAAADEAALLPEEAIRRLEDLAAAQRRLAELRPARTAALFEDLRRTEARLAEARGWQLGRRSEAAEETARSRQGEGDVAGAAAQLRVALRLQREANAGGAAAGRSLDRELRLQRELAELAAEPVQAAVATKTAAARAALAAARWEEARRLFREARELQERLNREFSHTSRADPSAMARLDAEIAALTADGLTGQVNGHVQRARQLRAAERTDEAVQELVAAAAAQQQLNERFAGSPFASLERPEEIEAERQSLLADEPERVAAARRDEARRFLRHRQVFQAQQSVRAGMAAVEELRTRFPKARPHDAELRTALAFLQLRAGDLAALQDRVYDQLAPSASGRARCSGPACGRRNSPR
ncbi:hypothetical protein [Oleiharenicola sp. Vm1]|uniref:hypothetical protein n=1 Tax=Oleiharenicola sp. Vm1 TaxID=3398393 RepID=UPI0039F5A7EE